MGPEVTKSTTQPFSFQRKQNSLDRLKIVKKVYCQFISTMQTVLNEKKQQTNSVPV